MFDYSWRYRVKTELFKTFIHALEPDINIDSWYIQKIDDALEFYQNEYVLLSDYNSMRVITETNVPNRIPPEKDMGSSPFYYVKPEYVSEYKSYAGLELYNEDALLKYINGSDAVIIDEAMFIALKEMFDSQDNDNHVLAMEIMANANYFESLVYLLLLIEEYGNNIYNQRSRNHVNFKSLCGYLGVTPGSVSQDDVCRVLIEKHAVTKDNMEIVLKNFEESLPDYYTYFKPQGITFSEDISKLLNEQLVIPLEQFTPEEVEEEIIEEDPVSEFAIEDNIEELDEPILEPIEIITLSEEDLEELKQEEPELNNPQPKQNGTNDIDWF
jgi:hypothetical protein